MEDPAVFFAPEISDIVDSYLSDQNDIDIDNLSSSVPCDFESGPCTSSASTEFGSTTEEELKRLENKNKNRNTFKSTNTWTNRLNKWMSAHGLHLKLQAKELEELDSLLAKFYAELRKEDGSEYEPDSLKVMLASLDRHFRDLGAPFSILKDKEFVYSRRVLNGKAIELRESGKGKRKMKADS